MSRFQSETDSSSTTTWLLLASAVVLYILSLTQTPFFLGGSSKGLPGWFILLFGWLGIIPGITSATLAHLTWLANPLLFLAWAFFFSTRLGQSGIWTSRLSLLIAICFPLCRSVIADEGGSATPITHIGLGYWLWLTSIALIAVALTVSQPKPVALWFEQK